jgi:surface antigen
VRGGVAEGARSARVALSLRLAAAALGVACAACSLTLPFEDRSAATAADPEITGSIAPRQPESLALAPGQVSPFSALLDDEDWRRQRAALATALDPQGNGGQARWENADSGHRGAFAAAGDPYVVRDDICRAFAASLALKEPEQWFHGVACRVSASEWAVREVKAGRRQG